jgi:hypothetical protein
MQQYYGKHQPKGESKLTDRSLARMEAFLASCAMALPDDRILPFSTATSARKLNQMGSNSNSNSNTNAGSNGNGNGNGKGKSSFITGFQSFATSFTTSKEKNGNNSGKRAPSSHNNKNNNNISQIHEYPQIDINDLSIRLEIYIRTLRRIYAVRQQVKQQQQQQQEQQQQQQQNDNNKPPQKVSQELKECVINYEPPRAIRARIKILLNSLIATTNSVGSMRPILTKLLIHLTRELLAVERLSEELYGYIRKIVLEYDHLTSFASLAFLSSPGDSADTHLSPLLYNYLEYLRNEWEFCIDKCKLESTLARAIHPGMRKVFKNSEFVSIGHLLEVCQGYKDQLQNIVILPRYSSSFGSTGIGSSLYIMDDPSSSSSPSQSSSPLPSDVIASAASGDLISLKKCNSTTTKAIKQALRDLRREIITVNGHVLPPAQSLTELVKLLRERLHSRTIRLKERKVGHTNTNGHTHTITKRQNTVVESSSSGSDDHSGLSYCTDNDIVSSDNEGDIDGQLADASENNIKGAEVDVDADVGADPVQRQEGVTKVKRRQFNVDAIDIMTRRLLLAASRTGCGGDAFFVV